jgi:hypothetical protein
MRKLGQAFALISVASAFCLVLGAAQPRADEPAKLRPAWRHTKVPAVVLTTGSTRAPESAESRAVPFETPADRSGSEEFPALRGTLAPEEPRP